MFIRDDVLENYYNFLKGRDVLSIRNFSGEFIRRDVVDMILLQQALKIGGFNMEFDYAPGRLNFRNTRMLEEGKLLLSFDSYWLQDAKLLSEDLYISEPVIRKGEYHAAIYASPKHPTIFNVSTIEDLRKHTAVSTPKWKTDWATLQALNLKELIHEDEWVSQAKMVSLRLVDFIMMPFTSEGSNTYHLESIKLQHIPNTALLLNDSRHFVVSKKHPLGKEAFTSLNKGLTVLRKENRITSAYKEAGFLIDTTNIKVLNAQ